MGKTKTNFESKTNVNHIKKAIKDLDAFDDTAQLYLIKKSTSNKLKNRLKLRRIEINGELDFFKDVLKRKLDLLLSKMNSSTNPLKDFFDEDFDDDDFLEISPQIIPPFPALLMKLNDIDNIDRLSELLDEEDFDSFAVDFNIDDCRLIWFRNIPRNKLIIESSKKIIHFRSNTFTSINDTTFAFDRITDAIYFQSSDSVIVCNKIPFERIFAFYEYYHDVAKNELEKIDGNLIEISGNMENLEGKIKLCKDIIDIKEKGGFPTVDRYREYQAIFQSLKDKGQVLLEKYTTINIVDDKLEISNEQQRETLVSIARSDILQEPISGKYYKALRKLSIEK